MQTFETIGDIQEEIDALERCLEDRHSWRISEAIVQLKELLAEAEAIEESEDD